MQFARLRKNPTSVSDCNKNAAKATERAPSINRRYASGILAVGL